MGVATGVGTAAASGVAPASSWKRSLAIALGLDALLCGFLLVLIGEVVTPLIVFGAAFAALAVATLLMSARWPTITALVAFGLFIVGNMPFIVEDLSHPDTFAGFAPIWLMVLTSLFGIAAAVMTLRHSEGGARVVATAVAAVALIGVVSSFAASASVEDDSRHATDTAVLAQGTTYPETLTVAAAEGGVFVENLDAFRHTFLVDGQDVKLQIPGKSSRRIDLALAPGSYTFRCDVPGHESMEGTLVVE